MDLKYIIKSQDEEAVVITKTGHESDFTIKDVVAHMKNLEKMRSECESQIKLEEATSFNILEHNKFISEMSLEDLHASHLYFQSQEELKDQKKKLEQVEEAMGSIEGEIKDIKKQTGVDIVWKK